MYLDDFFKIANKIKSKRLELSFSYQDLANLTGLSKSTLQRYESGAIKNIPLDKLEVLANALRLKPEQLMGWDTRPKEIFVENKQILSSEDQELLSIFNKLDVADKNKLYGFLSGLLADDKYKKIAIASGM